MHEPSESWRAGSKPDALLSDPDHSMPVTDYPSMEMAKLMLPNVVFVLSDGQISLITVCFCLFPPVISRTPAWTLVEMRRSLIKEESIESFFCKSIRTQSLYIVADNFGCIWALSRAASVYFACSILRICIGC
jgi:hypothetical protein